MLKRLFLVFSLVLCTFSNGIFAEYAHYEGHLETAFSWPDRTEVAQLAHGMATDSLKQLIESTALHRVRDEPQLRSQFLAQTWASDTKTFHMALLAPTFHFSHYVQASLDIKQFARQHFTPEEYIPIIDGLQDMVDALMPILRDWNI